MFKEEKNTYYRAIIGHLLFEEKPPKDNYDLKK